MDNELKSLQKKAKELRTLIEVARIVNSDLDLDKVLYHIMEKAQEVMRAEASSIFLLNPETNRLEIQSALGRQDEQIVDSTAELKEKISLEIGQGIAGWVAKFDQPLNIRDAQSDPRFFKDADKKTGFSTRTILAAPLKVRERLIGVAEVINRRDGQPFDDGDISLFTAFCNTVAMAIENARLHRRALEQERLTQQLVSAQAIQQSFLPQEFPVCPRNRFEVYAYYQPAKMIGGDFYDFLVLDPDHLGIVFGDVSGKGIPAALFMARMVSDFHLFASTSASLQEAVTKLNNALVNRAQRGMFVTFVGAVLNANTGVLRYVNAGHLPLIRISTQKHLVELTGLPGAIPLGILPDFSFNEQELRLDHGDFLLFVTDGITEMRNPKNEELTLNGIMAMVNQSWHSTKQLIESVLVQLKQFSIPQKQRDDMTMIALKYC